MSQYAAPRPLNEEESYYSYDFKRRVYKFEGTLICCEQTELDPNQGHRKYKVVGAVSSMEDAIAYLKNEKLKNEMTEYKNDISL